MVLVDTSVWLRFFYGQQPYFDLLDRLLDEGEVVAHELVYGELLIGDRGGRGEFLALYEQRPWAQVIPHEEVILLVRHRGLHGIGIGWIDAHLLASALADRLQLWTADASLAEAARALGVAYVPTDESGHHHRRG